MPVMSKFAGALHAEMLSAETAELVRPILLSVVDMNQGVHVIVISYTNVEPGTLTLDTFRRHVDTITGLAVFIITRLHHHLTQAFFFIFCEYRTVLSSAKCQPI